MEILKVQTRTKLYEGNTVKLAYDDNVYHVEDCAGEIYELSLFPTKDNYYDVYLGLDEVEVFCCKTV